MAVATADRRYRIDMDAMTPIKEVQGGYLALGDVRAHAFHVDCYEGDDPASLTDVRGIGYFIRADKTAVMITGVISGNSITVTLPSECYAVVGECALIVRLIHPDGTKRAILWVKSMVVNTNYDEIVNPGDPLPDIGDLLAAIDRMNAASDAVAAAVAEEGTFNLRLVAVETSAASQDIRSLLTLSEIPGTVQSVAKTDGTYTVTHKLRGTTTVKRKDVITKTSTQVKEVRTLYDGSKTLGTLTLTTNTTTGETEVISA